MIINEVCYGEVKKTLSELKSKYAELNGHNGSVEHEIKLRENELALYEAVSSGQAKLPNLNQFKEFPEKLMISRLAKGLSAKELAARCNRPDKPEISEAEIIGYELYDYAPAEFDVILTIAIALKEAVRREPSADGSTNSDELETRLLKWRKGRESEIGERYTFQSQDWDGKSSQLTSWQRKLEKYKLASAAVSDPDSQLFAGFSEALVMWRLAKKWSYRQLADQVDIDWIEIWAYERNDYYGTLFASMLKIAAVVENGEHEPSDYSFDQAE